MAELRQARVSTDTLVLYAENLSGWELSELLPAIKQIALQTRKKGETAFPPLADILERLQAGMVQSHGEHKSSALKEQHEQEFWMHVDYMKESTGKTEQEVLDAIKTPGYTGRKARERGGNNDGLAKSGRGSGTVEISNDHSAQTVW